MTKFITHIESQDQDCFQSLGQALTSPLTILCGRCYTLDQNAFEETQYSCAAKTALIALAFFTLPLSLLIMGIGCVLLSLSRTYCDSLHILDQRMRLLPQDDGISSDLTAFFQSVTQEEILAQAPANQVAEAAQPITDLLEECFGEIDQLPLAESLEGENASICFSKEVLKADFQRYADQKLTLLQSMQNDQGGACSIAQLRLWQSQTIKYLQTMREALPYHLHLDNYFLDSSPFPVTAIPNYGATCYINAPLQFFAHSRFCDYALLRPLDPEEPENTAEKREAQALLRKQVFNLREGIVPSKKDVLDLQTRIVRDFQGVIGTTNSVLAIVNFCTKKDYFSVCQDYDPYLSFMPKHVGYQRQADLMPWSVRMVRNPGHFWVNVKANDGKIYTIDDAVVRQAYLSPDLVNQRRWQITYLNPAVGVPVLRCPGLNGAWTTYDDLEDSTP